MCIYEIRKIHSNEVTEALALALEVFLQFEAQIINQRELTHSSEI